MKENSVKKGLLFLLPAFAVISLLPLSGFFILPLIFSSALMAVFMINCAGKLKTVYLLLIAFSVSFVSAIIFYSASGIVPLSVIFFIPPFIAYFLYSAYEKGISRTSAVLKSAIASGMIIVVALFVFAVMFYGKIPTVSMLEDSYYKYSDYDFIIGKIGEIKENLILQYPEGYSEYLEKTFSDFTNNVLTKETYSELIYGSVVLSPAIISIISLVISYFSSVFFLLFSRNCNPGKINRKNFVITVGKIPAITYIITLVLSFFTKTSSVAYVSSYNIALILMPSLFIVDFQSVISSVRRRTPFSLITLIFTVVIIIYSPILSAIFFALLGALRSLFTRKEEPGENDFR